MPSLAAPLALLTFDRVKLLSFTGRIGRADYWIGNLVVGIAAMAVIMPTMLLAPRAAMAIVWIAMMIPTIGLVLRRLHDRNRSGYFLLLYWGVPYTLGYAASLVDRNGVVSIVLALPAFVLMAWSYIELGFLRGTNGPNRFGPDPLSSS